MAPVIKQVLNHGAYVEQILLSPNKRYALTFGGDPSTPITKLWDLTQSGKYIQPSGVIDSITAIGQSENGELLALGFIDDETNS